MMMIIFYLYNDKNALSLVLLVGPFELKGLLLKSDRFNLNLS